MYDSQDDGMCLARAADIIRDDLFAKFPAFNGHFDSNYVHASVPKSLVCLVRMLLEGPHFMKNCPVDAGCDSTDNGDDVTANIAQLIRYNSTKKMRDGGKDVIRLIEKHHFLFMLDCCYTQKHVKLDW